MFFTASSGGGTVTISVAPNCANFDSQGFTGTFAGSGALTVAGTTTFRVGSTIAAWTHSTTITFTGASGTMAITTNGKSLSSGFTFNGAGGWQLQDNLTLGATKTLLVSAGTFDFNGKNYDGGFWSGSGTGVRTIIMGPQMTLRGTSTSVFLMSTTTNLTLTTGNPTAIICTDTGASAKTLGLGDSGTYSITLAASSGAWTVSAAANSTFTIVDFTVVGPTTVKTTTATSSWTFSGSITISGGVTWTTTTPGSTSAAFTILPTCVQSVASLTAQDLNFNKGASLDARSGGVNNGNCHNVVFATPLRLAMTGVG